MKSVINWLSKMLESMANAFMHPLKNDLPPSIGTHAYSSIPIKRKLRRVKHRLMLFKEGEYGQLKK